MKQMNKHLMQNLFKVLFHVNIYWSLKSRSLKEKREDNSLLGSELQKCHNKSVFFAYFISFFLHGKSKIAFFF